MKVKIYDEILDSYQAEEMAKDMGMSEIEAAETWFNETAYEMGTSISEMPVYSKFIKDIGEGKLYYDYGAGYYFLVDTNNTNESKTNKNMKKNVVKINENTLRQIIAESVKRVLMEVEDFSNTNAQTTPEMFKEQLKNDFETTLISIYEDALKSFEEYKGTYGEYMHDIAEEMAYETAESLTRDSMKVLGSNDWDVPHSNFRPLGFVMEREHGIHNFQELLSKPNPVEIYTNWFWSAFGTYGVKYKFQNTINDCLAELEMENKDMQ